MLNTLSTLIFDVAGYVEIQTTAETMPGESRRRVSRVATLDGGVVVNDGGFSEGDRTIELTWANERNSGVSTLVDRLLQFYPRLRVATREGVYLVAPEAFVPGAAESRVRLLVISKLSA